MGVIYKITCIPTNKLYIGQTMHTSKHRWGQHKYNARNSHISTQCMLLDNAIRKYGEENFLIEDIKSCVKDDLDDWEIHYIKKYDSFRNGLNNDDGGGASNLGKINYYDHNSNILPRYVNYYINEGYSITHHPNQIEPIYFMSTEFSIDECLKLILEELYNLNKETISFYELDDITNNFNNCNLESSSKEFILSEYIRKYKDKEGNEGYTIIYHPKIIPDTLVFAFPFWTDKENLDNALKTLKNINNNSYCKKIVENLTIYDKKSKDHNGDILSEFIRPFKGKDDKGNIRKGYRVLNHPGLQYDETRTFQTTSLTMDEKLQRAKDVLKSLNNKTYVKKVVTKITKFTLPDYVLHYKGSGDREGYTITGHPNQTSSVSFTDMKLSMEKKYELTLNVLEQLNNNTYVENIKFEATIDHNGNTLPNYIRRFRKKRTSGSYAEGYMVIDHPNLEAKFKGITDHKLTMDVKLDKIKNILKTLDENTYN